MYVKYGSICRESVCSRLQCLPAREPEFKMPIDDDEEGDGLMCDDIDCGDGSAFGRIGWPLWCLWPTRCWLTADADSAASVRTTLRITGSTRILFQSSQFQSSRASELVDGWRVEEQQLLLARHGVRRIKTNVLRNHRRH